MTFSWQSRFAVFTLASTSFMCLLGAFYRLWPMRSFACWVLLPSCAVLAWLAFSARWRGSAASVWVVQGTLGGLVAAVAYDLFRLPFVLAGFPLFGVFPRFGQMLLNASPTDFSFAVQATGWIYHFSNAAALGIMFLCLAGQAGPRAMRWGGVAWAIAVEVMLLLTPYYSFFKLKLNFLDFLGLTLSAHLIFGLVLGWWCARHARTQSG